MTDLVGGHPAWRDFHLHTGWPLAARLSYPPTASTVPVEAMRDIDLWTG